MKEILCGPMLIAKKCTKRIEVRGDAKDPSRGKVYEMENGNYNNS